MGWFNEPTRHSLARQGIKTGRKSSINYAMTKAYGHEYTRNEDTERLAKIFFIKYFDRDPEHPAERMYFDEWRHRFYTRHPEDYMDLESKKIYEQIKKGDTKLPKDWKGRGGITVKVVEHKVDYYKISSISDKDKVELIRAKIANMLRDKGYSADVEIEGNSINLRDIRISDDRVKEQGHNLQQASSTKSGIRKTRSLSWYDWVEVNDSVNDILDINNIEANVKSLGGKFDIRDKTEGRRSESDWESLKGDNLGSIMKPVTREDYIRRPEKKGTQFGILQPSGEVTEKMSIDINKVKSDDPLAYSYGYFQAKSGQPMSKDKGLAKEYIRGYKDAKSGKKIDMTRVPKGVRWVKDPRGGWTSYQYLKEKRMIGPRIRQLKKLGFKKEDWFSEVK